MTLRRLVVVACLACAVACDSSSSNSSNPSNPTSPGNAACRTYPTAATVTVSAGGLSQNATLTGAFNATTNQATVQVLFLNGTLCSTTLHNWRSLSDFVDEVRVVPPLTLETTATTTLGGLCGSGSTTVSYSYDAQRRLTQIVTAAGTTTYTSWDAEGRPLNGTFPGGTVSNVYNNATRTQTQTQTAGGTATVSTLTWDANGAQTQIVNTTSGFLTTTTFNNTSTARVCK